MVRVSVKFISIPRLHAGAYSVEFVSSESRLRDVLKEIADSYHIGDVMLTDTGDVRPYARVLVNERSFQFVGGLDVELHDGDALALIYPWLGHEDF